MKYKEQIKKVHTGHFDECYTRQRGSLPSVKTIALRKEPRPEHRYRFFAECNVSDTRQRGTLCRVPYVALGKEPDMRTLPGGFFAECPRWHSVKIDYLSSAARQTLGKDAVSVTRRRNGCFSLPLGKLFFATRQTSLSSARKKYSAKKALPMHCLPSLLC
jgi:hypothetical protein